MTNFAILILSCDKYEDIWEPFFGCMKAKWSNNKYPVYLLTNKKVYNKYGVNSIRVGDDISWSYNVKKALTKIPQDNILTIFDDLFIKTNVDTALLDKLIKDFIDYDMNYLRLNPVPKPAGKLHHNSIRTIEKGELYRSSAVFSIWKKDVLIDIINDKENAWEFEIIGSNRTDKYDGWYGNTEYVIPFYNLIIKGKYDPAVYRILTKENIKLSSNREIMSMKECYLWKIKKIRSKLFQLLIPWRLRRGIRSKFDIYKK